MDISRFEAAKDKIIGKDRQRLQIGTLSEKTVHAVVKNFYEPDEDKQEVPIEGLFADIFTGTFISRESFARRLELSAEPVRPNS